jgi:hypothetical protein
MVQEMIDSEDAAKKSLMAEVEVYDLYLRGEVYYYEVESPEGCEACGNVEWHHRDGCGGYYGDYGLAEIKALYPEAEAEAGIVKGGVIPV